MCRLFGLIKKENKNLNNLEKTLILKNVLNSYIYSNKDGYSYSTIKNNVKTKRSMDFKEFLINLLKDLENNNKIGVHLRFSTNIVNEKALHYGVVAFSNYLVTIAHNGVFNFHLIENNLNDEVIKEIEKTATIKNDTYKFLAIILSYLKENNLKPTLNNIKKAIEKSDIGGYGVVNLIFEDVKTKKIKYFLISIRKDLFYYKNKKLFYFNSNNDVNNDLKKEKIVINNKTATLSNKIDKKGFFEFQEIKQINYKEKINIKELMNSYCKDYNKLDKKLAFLNKLKVERNVIVELNLKTWKIKKKKLNIYDYENYYYSNKYNNSSYYHNDYEDKEINDFLDGWEKNILKNQINDFLDKEDLEII